MQFPGFSVGDVRVETPLVLAPMEDVTSLPMRLICKRIANPGLVFTEFVSAMAIHHGAVKTLKKMQIHPQERPLTIQIFGAEPDVMAETAKLCEEMGADTIDINMGCWVPKVCKTGSGAALLKDPILAEKIVQSVVKAVSVPVSVKVRAGWDYSLFAAPDLARRFQDAGVKMLTLHARFARQGFEGEADWDLIKRLRESVTVPLVGNGDVKTPEDAVKMMRETGCDGVMVGRAAISNPWGLGRIAAALRGEPIPEEPSIEERIETALEHARLQVAYQLQVPTYEDALAHPDHAQNEQWAIRSLRGQLPMYIKGIPGAAQIRNVLYQSSTIRDVNEALQTVLSSEFR
jgi:nifR3 family TIM-barrel protein